MSSCHREVETGRFEFFFFGSFPTTTSFSPPNLLRRSPPSPRPLSPASAERNKGFVCLRGARTGLYYVANPATFRRVRLRDHRVDADPAVVIAYEHGTPTRSSSAVGDFAHYHVVVALQVSDGVWAVESFSSRTWEWAVGGDICAPETVIASSGVGALGRAFWRTTIGHILCVTPETGRVDLIPAPHEVAARPEWEIGEMEGNFGVACPDREFREMAVLYMVPGDADEIQWAWAGQFDAHRAGCHPGMTLLHSQGAAEVVVWDSVAKLVIAMDFDGRQTRSIGPLIGGNYYTDFIPYIGSETEIYRFGSIPERRSSSSRAFAVDAAVDLPWTSSPTPPSDLLPCRVVILSSLVHPW